jgi:hypothetical protein
MRPPLPGGYFGRALIVDLDVGEGRAKPLSEEVLRSYIGGAGLGTWLMHECCPPRVDPLAAEAPLIFVFSPLVGTPLTTSAKFAVVAKSPLTGRLTDVLRRPGATGWRSSPASRRCWPTATGSRSSACPGIPARHLSSSG